MVIRLASVQIGKFWDLIKYSLQQTERVGSDNNLQQFNEVFAALLSDRAQCFIKYNEGLDVLGIMVTEILEGKYSGEKMLKIRSLYAFKAFPPGEWDDDFKLIRELAQKEKCTKIIFETSNARVMQLGKQVGFEEAFSTFEIPIGG